VKTAQLMARHSTPSLTIGRNAHADCADVQAALASLPTLVGGNSANVRTANAPEQNQTPVTTVRTMRAPNAHQAEYGEGRKLTQPGIKGFVAAALAHRCRTVRRTGYSGRPRTGGWFIANPYRADRPG
jgi:hypothetical protein